MQVCMSQNNDMKKYKVFKFYSSIQHNTYGSSKIYTQLYLTEYNYMIRANDVFISRSA